MSISAISAQLQPQSALRDKMTSALEANGLSADTAKSVSSEIGTIVQSASTSGSAAPDKTTIRAAIDTQIKADVASGKLTQDQANAVTKTLDTMDAQQSGAGSSSSSPPSGAPPSGGGGGGSAAGSSSSKTVVSTSSTTSGDKTTTITTYSDGSTSTTVSYLPTAKSAIQSATDLLGSNQSLDAKDRSTAASYLTALLSKGLVDTKA